MNFSSFSEPNYLLEHYSIHSNNSHHHHYKSSWIWCCYYIRKVDLCGEDPQETQPYPAACCHLLVAQWMVQRIHRSQWHMKTFRNRAINLLLGQKVMGSWGPLPRDKLSPLGLLFIMKWQPTVFVFFLCSLLVNFNTPNIFSINSC